MEVRVRHHTGRTCASIVAWLDAAQAEELRALVAARHTEAARALLAAAGMEVSADFDLAYAHWREPLLRELAHCGEPEDTSDEASTALVPDYARFATDLRELGRHRALVDKLAREADVDLGAAFGWED